MNKAILISIIVCLGVPFLLSLRSQRPRTFRRRALAIGFCVMLAVALFLPPDKAISNPRGGNGNTEYLAGQGDMGGDTSATLYAASEIDLSSYSVVGCAEAAATNYLIGTTGDYPAWNAFDGDTFTCWQDGVEGNGEGTELSVTLAETCELEYIVIYNGQTVNEDKFKKNGRVCQLEFGNGQYTEVIELADENVPVAIKLDGWENVSTVTFKINSVYPGSKFLDTCISEIVFYK